MPRHIYFDLDGTLTDPFEGITKSILYALSHLDAQPPSDQKLRTFIGPPLQVTFTELVGAQRAGRALELYRERFADVGWAENVPYAGIHEALEGLKSTGNVLFVATTKPWIFAEKIVEHFGMADYFPAVFGSELDGTRVDKTELLSWASKGVGSTSQHSRRGAAATRRQIGSDPCAAMVGDREHDMIGALNNGMDALGVSYGYGSVEELTAAGAERIVHAPSEFSEML